MLTKYLSLVLRFVQRRIQHKIKFKLMQQTTTMFACKNVLSLIMLIFQKNHVSPYVPTPILIVLLALNVKYALLNVYLVLFIRFVFLVLMTIIYKMENALETVLMVIMLSL
jgi:hypothetical protein